VCSNVYALPEQVGDAGLLFDPNNIDDMAEKIYKVWTDEKLRKELVEKGYERIKDMTLENYAKKWEKVISEALER
jgi:glycosyltransferase involved in cell wall biosynthesis